MGSVTVYVDSSRACNDLTFQLGFSQNIMLRTWSIKVRAKEPKVGHVVTVIFSSQVTQYSCSFSNLAPNGCTQYFFGAATNIVQTFNYNGGNGHHLANQDQSICVRYWRIARTCA